MRGTNVLAHTACLSGHFRPPYSMLACQFFVGSARCPTPRCMVTSEKAELMAYIFSGQQTWGAPTLYRLPATAHPGMSRPLLGSCVADVVVQNMDPKVLVLLAGGALLAYAVRRYIAGRHLRKVRGPPAPSWLLGKSLKVTLTALPTDSELYQATPRR